MRKEAVSFVFALCLVTFGMSAAADGYDFSGYKPDPKDSDRYMVYHLRTVGRKNPSYKDTVLSLASILSRDKGVIPGSSGFYLNRSKYSPDGARITIFVKGEDSELQVSNWIDGLVKDKGMKVVPYVTVTQEKSVFTSHYEGSEQAFRKYLALYTPITLECMGWNYDKTQADFWSLMENGGMDIEILEHSTYFMSLSYSERKEFINSLYFNRKWTHMVINFVLGYDND